MEVKIGKTKLSLIAGDITEQGTDAVVNAANSELQGGAGVDGAIHARGGPKILKECRLIGGCAAGDAVITGGGKLKAKHVIHAVGPIWRGGDDDEAELLAGAYRRSLEVAARYNLRSISFPAISAGVYGYPIRLAAPIALNTIIQFLEQGQHNLDEVRVVLYTRNDNVVYTVFVAELQHIMSKGTGN